MRDDRPIIKSILLILTVLVLMTACKNVNHAPSLKTTTFNFNDFENSDDFYFVLDVTNDYVYYYIIYHKIDVLNDEGEYLKKNDNVTIYKRDKEGNDSIVKENLGKKDISSLAVIDNDIYLISYEEIQNENLPIKYKITKNFDETLLEGNLDSTLALPSLHVFENKVFSLVENFIQEENSYTVTKRLYEFTNNSIIYDIDEATIRDLSEIVTLLNWSYGPSIAASQNNIVFSLSKVNEITEYIDTVIYVYDGVNIKEVSLIDTYITSVFEHNDNILFLKAEKEKETFTAVLSTVTLNNDMVKELDLIAQSITVISEDNGILTIAYTGVNGYKGFATLNTKTLEVNRIDDNLFTEDSMFFRSSSGVYRANANYAEGRGMYYDIIEKIH